MCVCVCTEKKSVNLAIKKKTVYVAAHTRLHVCVCVNESGGVLSAWMVYEAV